MLADLQRRVNEVADGARSTMPICAKCQQSRVCQDVRPVSCALFLDNCVWACRVTVAPRLLALLATVAPYPLAARCWV